MQVVRTHVVGAVMAVFAGTGLGLAQAPDPAADPAALLARARLIERQEGDLRQAEEAYRALLEAGAGPVQAEVELHLGALLWRLDRRPEALPLLRRVRAGGGEAGARAARILDGQGPQGEPEREVAVRVQDAVGRMIHPKMDDDARGDPEQDLSWLGHAAVPELVRQIAEWRAGALEDLEGVRARLADRAPTTGDVLDRYGGRPRQRPGVVVWLLAMVWRIGGPEAQRYLAAAAGDDDVIWRQVVAYTSRYATAELLPVVETMLRDDDPSGEVPVLALRSGHRLPMDRLVPLFQAPVARVREIAWEVMKAHPVWEQPDADERERALGLVEPHLAKSLADPDPATARAAFWFLCEKGARTRRGVELLLERLPEVPVVPQIDAANIATAPLASVLRCARALGPCEGRADDRGRAQAFVAGQVHRHLPAAGAGELLELAELGYAMYEPRLVGLAVARSTTDAERMRAAALMDDAAAEELARRERLPAEMVEPLGQHLRRLLGTAGGSSGRQTRVHLFRALGRTGDPAALDLLREVLAQQPDQVDGVAMAAIELASLGSDAEAVGALLRDLLVHPDLGPAWRNGVFQRLARRGDREAIPLYPRAYALGLEPTPPEARGVHPRRGAQWLAAWRRAGGGEEVVLHGYAAADLAEAWRALLDGGSAPQAVGDAFRDAQAAWREGQSEYPQPVRRLLAEHVARQAVGESEWIAGESSTTAVRTIAGWAVSGADENGAAIVAAVGRLLAEPRWTGAVLGALSPAGAAALADRIRPLLAGEHSLAALRALLHGRVAVTTEDLLACLSAVEAGRAPAEVLAVLPVDDAPAEVVRRVGGLVSAQSSTVRAAACETLGRLLSDDAVPILLQALRDADASVRAAAAGSLERLRTYHEQKAFWDTLRRGVAVGREAATGKLMLQAAPDQPREQRLLAIRSLGALGAPEALPWLIEWSQTGDEGIGAAARAAIDAIHGAAAGR